MGVLGLALGQCWDWEQGQGWGQNLAPGICWDPVLGVLSAELLAEQLAKVDWDWATGTVLGRAQGQGLALAVAEELVTVAVQ